MKKKLSSSTSKITEPTETSVEIMVKKAKSGDRGCRDTLVFLAQQKQNPNQKSSLAELTING